MTATQSQESGSGNFVIRRHESGEGNFETIVDPRQRDDWNYTGLHVLALEADTEEHFATEGIESMIIPLNGSVSVQIDGDTIHLAGRPDVFAGPADVLYVPVGRAFVLTSGEPARVAIASAVVDPKSAKEYPVQLIAKDDIPVEVRGAGSATRQVRNFGAVGEFDEMNKLIAVEVITPNGNWSSYPTHKHDEETESESELEEIYYFEISDSPEGAPGYGLHHTTSARPDSDLSIGEQVYRGDTILVPHGWHGPCAAAPGYDMYYLNVMAGPGERAWNITDHPDQAWIRDTWKTMSPDPRLT